MNTETYNELENCVAFQKKLRYFNEMISELRTLLTLETEELKPTQQAERELNAQIDQFNTAVESVERARTALHVTEQILVQVGVNMQQSAESARASVETTIALVESHPHVRLTYKAGLRGIIELDSEKEKSPETDAPAPIPHSLKTSKENGNLVLEWTWDGANSPSPGFEIAAAVGSLTVYRGTTTETDGQDFVTLGTTTPGAETKFRFNHDASVKDGVPILYRVRTIESNDVYGDWSEPLRVLHTFIAETTPPAETSAGKTMRSILSNILEIRPARARN